MRRLYARHREKINYLLVGGWNTVFGYLNFLLLYAVLGTRVHYLVIFLISTVLSITNAYVGYKIFVFKTHGHYVREYARFYGVYGATTVLNFLLLPVGVEVLHLSPPIAQGGLILLTIGLGYLGHKHFSFQGYPHPPKKENGRPAGPDAPAGGPARIR
jgi:putative flippase GtrA